MIRTGTLAFTALVVVACSAAQDRSQVQHVAIVAGCATSLAISRDAGGEAGDTGAIEKGCEAELRVWERAP